MPRRVGPVLIGHGDCAVAANRVRHEPRRGLVAAPVEQLLGAATYVAYRYRTWRSARGHRAGRRGIVSGTARPPSSVAVCDGSSSPVWLGCITPDRRFGTELVHCSSECQLCQHSNAPAGDGAFHDVNRGQRDRLTQPVRRAPFVTRRPRPYRSQPWAEEPMVTGEMR